MAIECLFRNDHVYVNVGFKRPWSASKLLPGLVSLSAVLDRVYFQAFFFYIAPLNNPGSKTCRNELPPTVEERHVCFSEAFLNF